MNCSAARERLPLLLYDGLEPSEASTLRDHLTTCSVCRQEHAELQRVRRALDSVRVPAVQVDLPRIFQETAALQANQARRWRGAAIAAVGIAAALLIVVLLRLEVRIDANQLAIRWGDAPAETSTRPAPLPSSSVAMRQEQPVSPELEERLRWMSQTLHALADNLNSRDPQVQHILQRRVERLEAHLEDLRRQDGQRWNETERNVAAIYRAVFVLPNQGEKQ